MLPVLVPGRFDLVSKVRDLLAVKKFQTEKRACAKVLWHDGI